MRIATFNVQNLRLRRFPSGLAHLDGARDQTFAREPTWEEQELDARDRTLTAQLIVDADADVIALQEVFNQDSLDHFHDQWLAPRGALYPHRVCVKGNDGRRHLAFMSRTPLTDVESFAHFTFEQIGAPAPDDIAPSERVLRRDCLTARVGPLLLVNCHFKACAPSDMRGRMIRRAEARAVQRVVEQRASDANWVALGDFNANDAGADEDLEIITRDLGAVDLMNRIPREERWTWYSHRLGHYPHPPDRIFAPPALAERASTPRIDCSGFSRAATRFTGERHADVGDFRPRASDHALVVFDVST